MNDSEMRRSTDISKCGNTDCPVCGDIGVGIVNAAGADAVYAISPVNTVEDELTEAGGVGNIVPYEVWVDSIVGSFEQFQAQRIKELEFQLGELEAYANETAARALALIGKQDAEIQRLKDSNAALVSLVELADKLFAGGALTAKGLYDSFKA